MMAELGGPRPREGIQEKVRSDVQDVASGAAWIKMIVPGEDTPDVVAGTVSLWSHETDGEWLSEIGWMVLPEFQGRGLGKLAVRMSMRMAPTAVSGRQSAEMSGSRMLSRRQRPILG